MSTKTILRPVATPEDQAVLGELMAPPEAGLSDAPLHAPLVGLFLLLLLSPKTPKEPGK
jgi:hypothetical protein